MNRGPSRAAPPALSAGAVALLALLATILGACEPAGVSLTVRVLSGLRAGGDVEELEALLFQGASDCTGAEGSSARRPVTEADQEGLASTGVAVGAFEGLRPGHHAVLVTARARGGVLLTSRCTVVSLSNDRVLMVGLTTDCTDIQCPGAGGSPTFTECLNGRCVEPACAPDDAATTASCCDRAVLGDLCDSVPTLCEDGLGCSGGLSCVPARACVDGICVEPSEDRCAAGEYCSVQTDACRDLDGGGDAGRPDAALLPDATSGADATPELDAAPDAATDLDAAPDLDAALDVDAAPDASSEPDAGSEDAASPADAGTDACVCSPGAVSAPLACGRCGSQTQSCGADCTWGPYGACSGEGPCSPGAVSAPSGCGRCGTRTQTCGADCTWGPYGACGGEGVCTPSTTSSRSCGTCGGGTQTRTCRSDCTWGSYGTCSGDTRCTDAFGGTVCPGARGESGFGCTSGCTRTCTCGSSGTWIMCPMCPTPPC